MMIRKKYPKEFKLDAISLVLEQGYGVTEAANNLGIAQALLSRWIKEHKEQDSQAFRGNGKLTAEQLEIRRLQEENKRLKMEKENLKKGGALLCSRNEIKYSFVAQHKKSWPVGVMCQLLGITRHGYYSYQQRQRNKPDDPEHQEMLEWVKKIAESSQYCYGSRRMKNALNALGYPVGRRRTQRLMKEAKIFVRYRKKYKVTTNSNHKQPVYENVLNREFDVKEANRAYVSDITYVWTQEGWLYLAVVMDLFSRKIVGWSMGSRMKATLVCDALNMAIWQRKPSSGLVVHSDRGTQYASYQYRKLLMNKGYIGSMSKKGDCWDNSVIESFFGSLKQERIQWQNYQTRWEAQQDILNYIIMFYNSHRLHSYLGYLSPNQFEKQNDFLMKVA
ncbi:IS3 family transposase [Legionella nautarum]|uniref:IS3 family transposase n=3 Tax=Legionella nautarum TaxID=45070 RepID=UPI003BF8A45B